MGRIPAAMAMTLVLATASLVGCRCRSSWTRETASPTACCPTCGHSLETVEMLGTPIPHPEEVQSTGDNADQALDVPRNSLPFPGNGR
jgi:hypothetical protein